MMKKAERKAPQELHQGLYLDQRACSQSNAFHSHIVSLAMRLLQIPAACGKAYQSSAVASIRKCKHINNLAFMYTHM